MVTRSTRNVFQGGYINNAGIPWGPRSSFSLDALIVAYLMSPKLAHVPVHVFLARRIVPASSPLNHG